MRDNYAAEVKALSQHWGMHKESMVFARLADRYLQLHEVEKAIEICQSGLRNHPHYTSAYFVLAKCYMALNQLDEAEKHLKHLLSRDPYFLNAHRLYAELMNKMGFSLRERDSYGKIQSSDPLYPIPGEESGFPATSTAPVVGREEREPAPPMAPREAAAPAPAGFGPEEVWSEPPAAEEPFQPSAAVPPPARADQQPSYPGWQEPAGLASPISEYKPPVPEMDLDAFAKELAALEVPAGEEETEVAGRPQHDIAPLAETPAPVREPESDFEREEIHFSEILDDLFSLSRDEEDRRELEARYSIERAALQPEPEYGRPMPVAEVVPPAPIKEEAPPAPRPKPVPPPERTEQTPFQSRPAPQPPVVESFPPEASPLEQPERESAAEEETFSAPYLSPVLPFRADEEWQEDNQFSETPESEEPIRLQPPTVESEPLPDDEMESPFDGGQEGTAQAFGDELGEGLLSEEEEEEQFTDFLANLDRYGGAALETEEDSSPLPAGKGFTAPWDEESEESPKAETAPPHWDTPRHSAPPPPEEIDEEEPAGADKPKEKFVTPTLGEIYAAQGQYAKAINVFEMLLKKNPENEWYRTKLAYLRKRLEEEK
jgi:tetratricopeptide (TPR) repeat protein